MVTKELTPEAASIRFDGRVCLVTGGGRGLGRAHARLLAERGARVVVNDLGCSRTGEGVSSEPAQETAALIAEAGGEAVVDLSDLRSPEGGAAAVGAAIDRFGRLDAVVCNAGTTETGAFGDSSLADFERLWRVHVGGTVNVLRAAWPHLAERDGRAVLTTSAAGLFGMAELAPYCAAKAAVAGLVRALAVEGRTVGIAVNGVAPAAYTRMFWDLVDDRDARTYGQRHLREDLVSPAVAWLCHSSCRLSGDILEVGGGRVARVVLAETRGYISTTATIEAVRDNFAQVSDETDYFVPTDANEVGEVTARLVAQAGRAADD